MEIGQTERVEDRKRANRTALQKQQEDQKAFEQSVQLHVVEKKKELELKKIANDQKIVQLKQEQALAEVEKKQQLEQVQKDYDMIKEKMSDATLKKKMRQDMIAKVFASINGSSKFTVYSSDGPEAVI